MSPSTSNFNAGANTIAFGPSGPVTCTGTASPHELHRLHRRPAGAVSAEHAGLQRVERAPAARALSVSLALDLTPANTSQRFVLLDNIVLRNSQPF